MEYILAAYTDAGRRSVNQDSYCLRRAASPDRGEIVMAVVCDGMGGLQKGELASAECVRSFGRWFDERLNTFSLFCRNDLGQVKEQWMQMLLDLHGRLTAFSSAEQARIGTTVAALFAYENQYITAHIGDSRIYLRKGGLKQLTEDQSLVAREIAAGRITEEEARHHPQRHILLQCLGAGGEAEPEFNEGIIPDGCAFLLCTDGLVHELSRQELEERFAPIRLNSRDAMVMALREAVQCCKERGEADNITALLIQAKESALAQPHVRVGGSRLPGGLWNKKNPLPLTNVLLEASECVHTRETI